MVKQKENASGQAGVDVAGGQAKATVQRKKLSCGDHDIKIFVEEIRAVGLQLRSSAANTQMATLPKVLEYLGTRGLNTYEGVALGYLRIATRIKELKETYDIGTIREDVIGPDGLWHKGVARYYMIGKKKQPTAGAEVAA
jgi:hypothetical protein